MRKIERPDSWLRLEIRAFKNVGILQKEPGLKADLTVTVTCKHSFYSLHIFLTFFFFHVAKMYKSISFAKEAWIRSYTKSKHCMH